MPRSIVHRLSPILIASACLWLGGCDMLGIESSEKVAAARDADGRAIGGACRHAARAIEDCYALNKKADKAAIFAGWRDMNDYMRENKIESVPSQMAGGKAAKHGDEEAAPDTEHEAKAGEHEAAGGGDAPAAAHPHAESGDDHGAGAERHAVAEAKTEKATKPE